MDAKKTIKSYIMPKAWLGIVGWILVIVMVASIAAGVVAMKGAADVEAYEFFPSESPNGTMAYIDVVGVSGWLYQYDEATYYTVEDAEGYMYTVRLKDSQFNAMSAQQEYWNRESDAEPMPEPYHLVGYVQEATDTIRSSLSQSWGITTIEYEYYFGTKLLNATTSVATEKSMPWFMGALFAGLFALLFGLICGRASGAAKKCLRQLEERNLLEKAAQQLEFTEGHTVIGKNKGILTQDFLFGKGTGAAIAYDDILWAYKQEQRRNFIAVNSYLMAGTRWMNPTGVIDMGKPDKSGCIEDALTIIAQRNPNALLGFGNANGKEYRRIVKESK